MTKVIIRKTNKLIEEESPKGANFLYRNTFGKIILKVATKRFVSKIGGFYMNKKISTKHIKNFIIDNKIDMSEYKEEKYKSFNEFFSRKIIEGKRNFSNDKKDFCAPCDSKVLAFKIDKKSEFIIKGKKYTLERILRDNNLAKKYENGYFIVFRLSVDDYHRYAYIDNGEVISRKEINGKFHTVGPIAFENNKVYQENQREYELMKTDNFGEIIQMEVGALMVGKIKNYKKEKFKRGEEKGYFLFGGSTVIIIVNEKVIRIDEDILKNSKNEIETKVQQGERVARKVWDV